MQNFRLLVGFLGEKAQIVTRLEDPGMIPAKIHICTVFTRVLHSGNKGIRTVAFQNT